MFPLAVACAKRLGLRRVIATNANTRMHEDTKRGFIVGLKKIRVVVQRTRDERCVGMSRFFCDGMHESVHERWGL